MPFLEKLALNYLKSAGYDLSDHVFIFPNRRAGIFFNRILSKHTEKPVWAPETYSIIDFVKLNSRLQIPDKLVLLFELYIVYKNYIQNESFENFIPWGTMLLNDFDELDKSLVNAEQLFTDILELKKIEEKFSVDSADIEAFRTFMENTYANDVQTNNDYKEEENLKKIFFKFWRIAGNLYKDFHLRLTDKNLAYEGMVYKSLATGKTKPDIDSNKNYIFAGFNAMSLSEAEIVKKISNSAIVHIYWQADSYYMDDKDHEAGYFIRKCMKYFPDKMQTLWKEDYLITSAKKISVYPVPTRTLQAVSAGNIIIDILKNRIVGNNGLIEDELSINSAVILPDEQILFPVLNSIPEEVSDFNVTMGFPLGQSAIYGLFTTLHHLNKYCRIRENKAYFKTSVLLDLIDHPYIKAFDIDLLNNLKSSLIQKNLTYICAESSEFENINPILINVLFYSSDPKNTLINLDRLTGKLLELFEKPGSSDNIIISLVHTQIRLLIELFVKYDVNISIDSTWQIVLKLLRSLKAAFTGEPLKGLQIMGLLETRCLDFKDIIVLSMNEKYIPATNRNHSYIPYHLRKAYGLPAYDEQEAISANLFYRLVQSADNIHLLYVNSGADQEYDEVSRYVLQIKHELIKANHDIDFKEVSMQTEALQYERVPLKINKNADIIEKMLLYCKKEQGRSLYPTAITQFVKCPVTFSFKYILGIKEKENIAEELDARIFGQVLHDTMESLYGLSKGKTLIKNDIKSLQKDISAKVDQALYNHFPDALKNRSGKNYLLRNVIIRLISKILEQDEMDAPFTIIALENTSKDSEISLLTPVEISNSYGNFTVYLNGKADRIDEVNGIVRVLDYKTGKVELKKKFEIRDLFEDPALNAVLQTYLYTYMYKKNYPQTKVKAGIYAMNRLNEGITFLREEPLTEEELYNFENELKLFLSKLFDPHIPFEQTNEDSLNDLNTLQVKLN